jgi:hypothetical protein
MAYEFGHITTSQHLELLFKNAIPNKQKISDLVTLVPQPPKMCYLQHPRQGHAVGKIRNQL